MGSKRYLSRLERRAEYFVSPRDEALPRVSLECNPEIPVAPGEEHYVLDKSLDAQDSKFVTQIQLFTPRQSEVCKKEVWVR